MELRVTNIHGQIGIRTSDAVLTMRSPKAELSISTEKAQVNIETQPVRVKIDQSQCFSEAGLKSPSEFSREIAENGRQAVLEGIARMVAEGNRMAKIQQKGNAVVEIAVEKSLPAPNDFNVAFIPQSRPRIEVEGGIFFDPTPGRLEIQAAAKPVEAEYSPYQVEIYMLQNPEFHYEFIGQNIDVTL